MSEKVSFWFDPSCPWTWITSRWLVAVSQTRDLEISWQPFSLYELNKGKDVPAEYWERTKANRIISRTVGGVATTAPDKLGDFYTELGTRFFVDQQDKSIETIGEALEAVGLSRELIDSAQAGDYDELMEESTSRALSKVGDDVGVPIIEVAQTAFFGPVISPAPKGQEALDLWDGILAAARVPAFFELKRSRTVGPIFD